MAWHVEDRSRRSATRLWAKMPAADRQHATFSTDPYAVYGVMPAAPHQAISTLARPTDHIERFNTPRRPRVFRLVREALSCSKKLTNRISALTRCIGHDNLTSVAA